MNKLGIPHGGCNWEGCTECFPEGPPNPPIEKKWTLTEENGWYILRFNGELRISTDSKQAVINYLSVAI